ncbi:succinate dehydrogenase cytochrome b558 subunit [Calderihabitans maritimus]|uniref:Succinate dehydrogenase, cytochrome b558 subunit n=1 Tax=Calderihabitans maritimus TaxID=1246530 RepID=A0A1Z5HWC0_9FIRM|nr:succinate dehydrogenase cytochrome b558 subunit [Calderihabitans maritimus]GAW93570.1 succinate dehydrogenase, cytochrome b558 subunit [Calderihabitans maritimus]
MSFLERNHFFIRKLHSLAGIFPIGFFLLEHLYTNSFAMYGADAYNSKIEFFKSLPYLIVIELGFILVPILFHALYGLYIVYLARNNVLQYTYFRNWMFYLQRITAVITLIFVVYHVYTLRLSSLLYGTEVSFATMTQILSQPAMLIFYVVGLVAATFHFANGLWAFLVSWGITIGPNAQRVSTIVCGIIFILLTAMGINSLAAFIS